MNPLERFPKVRAAVYSAYWTVGLLLGCVTAGLAAVEHSTPGWLVAVLGAYTFLGGPIGYTARANTPVGDGKHAAEQGDE